MVISVAVASRGGFAPVQGTSAFPFKRPLTRLARSPSCIAISNHPLLELPLFGLALKVYNLGVFAGKRKFGLPYNLQGLLACSCGLAKLSGWRRVA
jgi:hypothetical protein